MIDYEYIVAETIQSLLDNEIVDEQSDDPLWFSATQEGYGRVSVRINDSDDNTRAVLRVEISEVTEVDD